MPEGPEVKIASDYFNKFFSTSNQIKFEIISEYYHDKYSDVFNTISDNLKIVKSTYTIGKNIFLDLENKQIFNFHLGMTGGWSNELVKHCHFRVFDCNKEMFFRDVRKFGNMKIITQSEFKEKHNPKYDLLNKSYNLKIHLNYLETKIKSQKSICSIIMDQKYFPGVGNYIKSESLYASNIHPEEKWGNLKEGVKVELIKIIQRVMNESYKSGGAELKDFKNPFNPSKFKLQIYGKKYTDKNNIVTSKKTSDSRKTWFCSKYQKLI
ncbi:MAG: DNA-formamidopyrimidine glycosylase family protein [Flavobacteriales bacterium]